MFAATAFVAVLTATDADNDENGFGDILGAIDVSPAISAGSSHSLALKDDGTVWAFGTNNYGQLGVGDTMNRDAPVQVKDPSDPTTYLTGVTAISAGYDYSLALKSDGTVWAWGSNECGRLGDNTTDSKNTPVQVKGPGGIGDLTGVTAISAGGHSMALKSDGTVWAWGANNYNQLGIGTGISTEEWAPVQVHGANNVGFLTGVTAISAGYYHSFAIKSDGTVWAWGRNNLGQLGIGESGTGTDKGAPVQVLGKDGDGYLTDITEISGGGFHSLALKSDGTVWAWGSEALGSLGIGTYGIRSTPVQVHDADNIDFLTGVTAISAGLYHSLALGSDGTVWAWGGNARGQLGVGDNVDKYLPKHVLKGSSAGGSDYLEGVTAISGGNDHALALKSDGAVCISGKYNQTPVQMSIFLITLKAVTPLPGGTLGMVYSHALTAIGTRTVTWSLMNGSLPDGLTLSSEGVISGTPSEIGTFMFNVTATDITGNIVLRFSMTVAAAAPEIATSSLPNGTVGTAYSQMLTATGTGTISWSVASGSLPAGLSLSSDTGAISGTPTATGMFSFVVKATGDNGSDMRALSMNVAATAVAPAITTSSLLGGVIGTVYSQTLTATGTAPITWSVESGSMPDGLTLLSGGAISGTPSAAGAFDFTVKAENGTGSVTKALSITITATAVAPAITASSLLGGVTGTAYSQTLTATGTAPMTWSVAGGSLPAGLDLNGTTGTISGTPTAAGTFDFTVKAENGAGSITKALSITVTAGGTGGTDTKSGGDDGGGGIGIVLVIAIAAVVAVVTATACFFFLRKN